MLNEKFKIYLKLQSSRTQKNTCCKIIICIMQDWCDKTIPLKISQLQPDQSHVLSYDEALYLSYLKVLKVKIVCSNSKDFQFLLLFYGIFMTFLWHFYEYRINFLGKIYDIFIISYDIVMKIKNRSNTFSESCFVTSNKALCKIKICNVRLKSNVHLYNILL